LIYPDNFESKIGFSQIREKLKNACLSSLGKNKVDKIGMLSRYDLIKLYIDQVAELKYLLENTDDFPVDHYYDLLPSLKKIDVEGAYLTVDEVFQLYKSLSTIKNIIRYIESKEKDLYPRLHKLIEDVKVYPYITESIERIITKQGKIKDNASPELKRIKSDILVKSSSVSKLINSILKKQKDAGFVDKDVSASIRDGRLVIPIDVSSKRKIQGIIHDESSTGKTVYIEPTEIVELNNVIKELELAEKREIVRILIEFTSSIRSYIIDLEKSYDFLGTIDLIRAKAKFAIQINGLKPNLQSKSVLNWKNAKHPLLLLAFKEQNKKVVPLNISLEEDKRILIISGPNAGGKSVCLKTVGLIQYMMQCGLLVPTEQDSIFGIFQHIFIDIGDEQSLENDLSTYSSHLINMRNFIKQANNKSLVLIDEFGVGTEPALGGAIAESILEELNNKEVSGVITTHYTNLKHYASQTKGIINGAMLYDNNKMEPLFQLEIGKPGSSFAFEIASKIGLSHEIIEQAKGKIGEDHVSFDKHLREIARDKRYWENKRQKIRKSEKRLEEIVENQAAELDKLRKERKEIISKAKEDAENILSQTNKKIENTIRIIKETQAEKEKVKTARGSLEEFKQDISKKSDKEQEKIENKFKKLKDQETRIKAKNAPIKKETVVKVEDNKEFRVGCKVKIIDQEVFGEVIDMNEKSLVVAFGNMVTTIDREKLKLVSNNEFKKNVKVKTSPNLNTWDIAKRKINFSSGLDIRGKRADEAIQLVTEFIDEAIMVEVYELKILHGKGNGILRHSIREYLKTVDLVESCGDAHIDMGGAGITIVKLGF
jgi:DNA mismatch repair protein MutS2